MLIIALLVIVTIVLIVAGMVMAGRGTMSRVMGFVWAVLIIVPLFGGGLYLFFGHEVERANGVTQPGQDTPLNTYAP